MKKKLLIIALLAMALLVGCASESNEKSTEITEDNHATAEDIGKADILPEYKGVFVVREADNESLVVAELGENGIINDTMQFIVPNLFYPSTEIEAGDEIMIEHSGEMLKAYPLMFTEIYTMEYYDEETGESIVVEAK